MPVVLIMDEACFCFYEESSESLDENHAYPIGYPFRSVVAPGNWRALLRRIAIDYGFLFVRAA
jgi:hypothetical protein